MINITNTKKYLLSILVFHNMISFKLNKPNYSTGIDWFRLLHTVMELLPTFDIYDDS